MMAFRNEIQSILYDSNISDKFKQRAHDSQHLRYTNTSSNNPIHPHHSTQEKLNIKVSWYHHFITSHYIYNHHHNNVPSPNLPLPHLPPHLDGDHLPLRPRQRLRELRTPRLLHYRPRPAAGVAYVLRASVSLGWRQTRGVLFEYHARGDEGATWCAYRSGSVRKGCGSDVCCYVRRDGDEVCKNRKSHVQ